MRGLVEFGVRRSVVINLLTIAIVAAGIASLSSMRREFFPEANPEAALIWLSYPGASPQEIEESMARKIEDAVADLDDVDRLRTNLAEGRGSITVELTQGADAAQRIDDIRVAIDALQDLPEDADRIRVTELEPNFPVIMLTLSGDVGETALKESIRKIADELRTLPGMGSIVVSGTRRYEIRIDADPFQLKRHGLSLPQVADIVKAWMAEVPGGTLRTPEANISVRTLGVEERAEAIRQIPLKASTSGQVVRLDEVATVSENFVDEQVMRRFNGKPSVSLIVFKQGEEDAVRIAEMVRGYVAAKRGQPLELTWREKLFGSDTRLGYELGRSSAVPVPGQLVSHNDLARIIEGRLDLLTRNALQGACLVFLAMLLLMNARAATWVMTGIFVAVGATLVLMKLTGITLNLITMFGLLVVIGMLADDAIVVTDNILAHAARGVDPETAAIEGTNEVFWPVIATVSTTIVAFVPLSFLGGRIGELLTALPMVAAVALGSSLIEAMLILPNHTAHALRKMRSVRPGAIGRAWGRFEAWREARFVPAAQAIYRSVAWWCIRHRYITFATFVSVLLVSVGMVVGARVPFTFLPADDTETVIVEIRLPIGSTLEQTSAVAAKFEAAASAQPEVSAVSVILGQSTNFETGVPDASATHVGQMFIELVPVETRSRVSGEVVGSIRDAVGSVDEAEEVRVTEVTGGPSGADITYQVRGEDRETVRAAVDRIKETLAGFDGVFSIADDDYSTQRELKIELRPAAAAMGLSVAEVARQVRGILFGLDAHVFSADREDIKVRVRLAEPARTRLDSIESLWISTPTGALVPLGEVATVREGTAYAIVRRVDRERTVTVTADCGAATNPEEITAALAPTLRTLEEEYPSISIRESGRQKDLAEAFASLPGASLAALCLIYVILAALFSSYSQPFAVMLAIPFSVIGVVWGHWLLGYDITFLSVIGFVALAGVVVNNSLIFVEFANATARRGGRLDGSLIEAGERRLRPIFLTTITTVFGLLPLLLEHSFQARFLIPMAISITAGLTSATVLTLLLLPAMLMLIDDMKAATHWLWYGMTRTARRERSEAWETRSPTR